MGSIPTGPTNGVYSGSMRYFLSKIIPMHFHTVYRVGDEHGQPMYSTWWQWRGRIFGHTSLAF